ncbi:MAG: right-handed parallel beta-helix repeat-containing protein, partial [Planctomycetota bacterium]
MRFQLLALGLLISIVQPVAGQVTLTVPAMYPTVAAAIDAAEDGDTVLVATGVYPGFDFWFFGKAIHVKSIAGPETTIVINSGIAFINNEGPESILEGFTIDGAPSSGVYCESSSPTIRNNVIRNCSSTFFGGGIYTFNAKPGETYSARIIGNRIEGNYGSRSGGGIMVRGAPAIIQDNVIANNSVG